MASEWGADSNCDQNADDWTWSERQAFQRKHSARQAHIAIHCICSLSSLMLNQISGFWSCLCAVWGPSSLSNNCCGWFLWNMGNTLRQIVYFALSIFSLPNFWLIRGAHFQLRPSNKSCDFYFRWPLCIIMAVHMCMDVWKLSGWSQQSLPISRSNQK